MQAPAELSVTARPGVLGTLQVIHSYQCGQVPSSPKDGPSGPVSPTLITDSIGLCCVSQGSFQVCQLLASLLGMSRFLSVDAEVLTFSPQTRRVSF